MDKMQLWARCSDCGGYWDKFKSEGCPSPRCLELRAARRKAAEGGRWWKCIKCRNNYQAVRQSELYLCPTCTARREANLAREVP
jgi:hypothetical protein